MRVPGVTSGEEPADSPSEALLVAGALLVDAHICRGRADRRDAERVRRRLPAGIRERVQALTEEIVNLVHGHYALPLRCYSGGDVSRIATLGDAPGSARLVIAELAGRRQCRVDGMPVHLAPRLCRFVRVVAGTVQERFELRELQRALGSNSRQLCWQLRHDLKEMLGELDVQQLVQCRQGGMNVQRQFKERVAYVEPARGTRAAPPYQVGRNAK